MYDEEPLDTAPAESDLPAVELDEELLYQLLLGEFAVQREDYATAAKAFSDAAKETGDYRVAERAARVALRAKDFKRAKESARMWADLRPEDTSPLEIITLVWVENGDVDEAQAVVEELLGRDASNSGRVYRRLAELLSRQSNQEAALDLMSRLAVLSPEDPDVYYANAYLAGRLKEPDLLIQYIDKALELKPGWEEAALVKVAHLSAREGAREQVTEFCARFLDDYPDASRIRLYFARFLVDHQEFEQGLDQLIELVKREPENADALYSAGLLGIQLERYDEAEEFLRQNLSLRPKNDQARLYLGQLAAERESYDEAEQWYREIQSETYFFQAQLSIGDVLAITEGTEAAISHMQSLHPGNKDEYVRWVLTQEQILRDDKQLMKAKEILDVAVERYPDDTELLYARGLVAAQLQLIDVHERDMRKLIVKDPNNAHALNALGYTLADITDRYEEAHTLIEQALSIRPEDPFILDSMGWVQYRLGNHADAIEYLERALTKREDAEIAAHLGEVLWVNGEQERAKEIWRRAMDQHPENDVLLNTLKKFNQ